MNYAADLHTHTIASGHAYSTIQEMIAAAKAKEMKVLGITEHAPLMPGSCAEIYFHNLRVVPRMYGNLKLLLGAELNVKDIYGNVDLSKTTMQKLDLRIASFHFGIVKFNEKETMMKAVEGALSNPYVDILGHPDDGRFPYDYEQLASLAAKYNKIIEINNASLQNEGLRPHAYENDIALLKYCEAYRVPVIIGSDAHISYDVGACKGALKVIHEADFSMENVLNYDVERLFSILEAHKKKWTE